ncbi:hypothetical protein [Luteimonas vadosa]|uniref:hypothetical protein n=1 Tax=Luteimonas vadosa TaxID=1165507 RepID=UPI0031EDEF5E
MMRKDPTWTADQALEASRPQVRREPTLGSLEGIDTPTPAPRRRPWRRSPPASIRRWAWRAAAVVGVLLLAVLVFRQPIADWIWPETRAQALQSAAARALASNRLTAADGSGARELYEAALAIDPDRGEALTGLANVASAALVASVAALRRNDFETAHGHLRLARELSVPAAHADAVADALRRREAAHAGIDQLMARAEAAHLAGRLDGDPQAALPLYRRVLELQPERADALRGREDALTELLDSARAALREGDLDVAARRIALARKYDPGHVDLPDSQARLTEETEALRRRADRDLKWGRLPEATRAYRSLLALSATDEAAVRGLLAVAGAHAARAQRFAADFRFGEAQAELEAARALAPDAAEVRDATRRLARARQSSARLSPGVSSRDRDQRVRSLLADAAAAEARGDLLAPPGESAFDKVRAARALAPDSRAVREAAARLLGAANACFERELRGNSLGRARACLDARSALSDDDAGIAAARRRLAERWLAVGNERLGADELQAAAAALAQARALDRSTPGLAEFDQRMRAATASND